MAHKSSFLKKYHFDHHKNVVTDDMKWKWNNLLLYNDTKESTIDLWLTEVIPTIIFCLITRQWWIFIVYYVWTAFIQERIEHNKEFDIPVLTSGKWHLMHHEKENCNFGLFTSLWDKIFNTNRRVK